MLFIYYFLVIFDLKTECTDWHTNRMHAVRKFTTNRSINGSKLAISIN